MDMLHVVPLKEALRVFGTRQNILSLISASRHSLEPHVFEYQGIVYLHEYESLLLEKRAGKYALRFEPMYSSVSRWKGRTRRKISLMDDQEIGGLVGKGMTNTIVVNLQSDLGKLGIKYDYLIHTKKGGDRRVVIVSINNQIKEFAIDIRHKKELRKFINRVIKEIDVWNKLLI